MNSWSITVKVPRKYLKFAINTVFKLYTPNTKKNPLKPSGYIVHQQA